MNKQKTGLTLQATQTLAPAVRGRMLLFFAAAMLASNIAFAASATDEQQLQLRALYAELMLEPTNVEKTMQYAKLASDMGNYEAAIAPLERILISYPNANKIKLQLGNLYALLNADDVATDYYQQVANDAAADAALRNQAQQLLSNQ